MKLTSTAFVGLFLVSPAAFSQDLFIGCSTIAEDKAYKPLGEYFASARIDGAYYCQRLNDYEFVYVTDRNFHYCNFKLSPAGPCVENEKGIWYPDLEIETRFTGANGKKFILFKTSRLSHGVYGSRYQVFFFTPKKDDIRGYKISPLQGAGEDNGSYSDEGGICSNMAKEAQAISGTNYEIANEGTKNLVIRFDQTLTSCKTGALSSERLEYVWTGRDFVQAAKPKNR